MLRALITLLLLVVGLNLTSVVFAEAAALTTELVAVRLSALRVANRIGTVSCK